MNDQNLKRGLTPSEAREYGRMGGIKSGEARRRKAELRECLETALQAPYFDAIHGQTDKTNAEQVAIALVEEATKGNVSAFREIRDTLYGRPTVRVEQDYIPPEVYERVEAILSQPLE